MGFIKQLKETAVSVLPIAIIAAIAGLGLNVFSTDGVSFVEFIFSVILVVLGLTIFLLGVDVGLIPVGNQIGAKVTRKKNVVLLLLTGFFLGAIITVAEPDVQVLAKQVNEINSEISVSLLTMMICIGVGLFVAISFLRSIMNWSLKITLSISVVLLFIVAAFNREFFVFANEQGTVYEKIVCHPSYASFGSAMVYGLVRKAWDKSAFFSSLDYYRQNLMLCFLYNTGISLYQQWVKDGRTLSLEEFA